MLDKLLDLLNFAFRQKEYLYAIPGVIKKFFCGDFTLQRLIASLLAICELFGGIIFDNAITPSGDPLDLTGYELVMCDEFEGNTLNTDLWEYRASGARRSGYNAPSQVEVKNGNLYLTGEYLENGTYGEGWYAGMIALCKKYKQGYFEIKCICNKDKGFWSAFWIQGDHPYDHYLSKGGVGSAELDIFEAMEADSFFKGTRNSVSQTIHCNGYDDDPVNIDSCKLGQFKGKNIFEEYNTYGLKWTEDEYIFYVNGIETARSSFGNGVSQEEEQVIVSLEIPDSGLDFDHDYKTQFIVDYVKIWQVK